MDAIDLGQAPGQAVPVQAQAVDELGADGHRVDRRTVIVQQTGNDGLAAARAAADFVRGFQHGHLYARLGEGDGGGQPVRAAPHDGRGTHVSAP